MLKGMIVQANCYFICVVVTISEAQYSLFSVSSREEPKIGAAKYMSNYTPCDCSQDHDKCISSKIKT